MESGALDPGCTAAATEAQPLCFLIRNRDLSCLQVTEAGSRLPCREGLSLLGTWRVGVGGEGKGRASSCSGLGGTVPRDGLPGPQPQPQPLSF